MKVLNWILIMEIMVTSSNFKKWKNEDQHILLVFLKSSCRCSWSIFYLYTSNVKFDNWKMTMCSKIYYQL